MKKLFIFSTLSILALVLTACGSASSASAPTSPPASSSNSHNGYTQSSSGSSQGSSSNPAPADSTPTTGLSALQLAAGLLKLDGSSNAVTPQEATQLLPLWQSLAQIESVSSPQASAPDTTQAPSQGTPGQRPDSAMMQQVSAQIVLIQNAMPPAQIQAITALNLSREEIFTIFQQAGITMGGNGQGGGYRPNGGTFTPPNDTPRAPGGNGYGQGGGRPGFGGFIPPSVVNGIVQYLQTKAAS